MKPGERMGAYELLSVLGKGASGSVFRARHPSRGDCALKVFTTDARGERLHQMEKRFHREAEAVARLEHPGIVRILEASEAEGRSFIAFELVPGRTLRALIDEQGRFDEDRALALAESIARALDFAHARGIVHRDVKPENVIVRPDGTPVLVDFGIAKETDLARSRLTESGALLGTPVYLSPEQARGDSALCGPATDVWGLGCVLHELVAGSPPFQGQHLAELLERIDAARPASAPGKAGDVCRLALARDPSSRPSARELAELCARARKGAARGPTRLLALASILAAFVVAAVAVTLHVRSGGKVDVRGDPGSSETAAARIARLERGEARGHELDELLATASGTDLLRRLASSAVAFETTLVHAAALAHPGSRELAVLDLVALVARSTEISERRGSLAHAKTLSADVGPGQGAALVRSVAAIARLEDDIDALHERKAEAADASRIPSESLDQAIAALEGRPDLQAGLVRPLARVCRRDIVETYAGLGLLAHVFKGASRLEPLLERAPTAVGLAYVTHSSRWPQPIVGAVADRLLAATEELASRASAEGDPLLAAHGCLVAMQHRTSLDPADSRTPFDADRRRAEELLAARAWPDALDANAARIIAYDVEERVLRELLNAATHKAGDERARYLELGLACTRRSTTLGRDLMARSSSYEQVGHREVVVLLALGRIGEARDEHALLSTGDPLALLLEEDPTVESVEGGLARREVPPGKLYLAETAVGLRRSIARRRGLSVEGPVTRDSVLAEAAFEAVVRSP